jgi:hypothetical protein
VKHAITLSRRPRSSTWRVPDLPYELALGSILPALSLFMLLAERSREAGSTRLAGSAAGGPGGRGSSCSCSSSVDGSAPTPTLPGPSMDAEGKIQDCCLGCGCMCASGTYTATCSSTHSTRQAAHCNAASLQGCLGSMPTSSAMPQLISSSGQSACRHCRMLCSAQRKPGAGVAKVQSTKPSRASTCSKDGHVAYQLPKEYGDKLRHTLGKI